MFRLNARYNCQEPFKIHSTNSRPRSGEMSERLPRRGSVGNPPSALRAFAFSRTIPRGIAMKRGKKGDDG